MPGVAPRVRGDDVCWKAPGTPVTPAKRGPGAPGVGMDQQSERRLPSRVTRILVKPKALAGDRRAGGRVDQRDDRTNRNGQRGRVRATSMLGNAKSGGHRKTHRVASGGAFRKSMHLARAGVGRGRSSEEGCESSWSKGPKARRDRLTARLRPHPESRLTGRPHAGGHGRGRRRWIPADEPTEAAWKGRAEGCE